MSDLLGSLDSHHSPVVILDPAVAAGASVVLHPGVMTDTDGDALLSELQTSLAWEQRHIQLFGKRHLQPRLVAWYGDAGAHYRYSGQTLVPQPWTPTLAQLRDRCEQVCCARFNSVLCNLYRDGNDAMGWHADDEPELGADPTIASLSLGWPRRFDLRHRQSRETVQAVLPHGSVLVMRGRTQAEWQHQIARSKKVLGPRINLTFRWVSPRTTPQ